LTEAAQRATERADKLAAGSKTALEAATKRIVDGEIKLLATQPVEKDGKVQRLAFRPDALDIVIALIDRTGITDEDGKLTAIDAALEVLAREKPFLLVGDGKPQTPVPKGTPGPTGPKPGNQTQTQPATPTVVVGTSL
jgi:hypothetical protein